MIARETHSGLFHDGDELDFGWGLIFGLVHYTMSITRFPSTRSVGPAWARVRGVCWPHYVAALVRGGLGAARVEKDDIGAAGCQVTGAAGWCVFT